MSNYFRKFIQGYSKLATPLTNLTKKDKTWEWTNECQQAFEHIKECLTSAPLLRMPDPSRPFEVIADASKKAVGAILMQDHHPICYANRKFILVELNYSVTDQKALASIHAVQIWRCYLEGTQFSLVTDHCPLTYLKTQPQLSRRQARWSEILEQFDFKWEYRPGRKNVADPLSRIPESPESQVRSRKSFIRRSWNYGDIKLLIQEKIYVISNRLKLTCSTNCLTTRLIANENTCFDWFI